MGLTPRSVHQSLAPAPVEGTWNAWVRFLVEILAAVGDRMLRPTQSALLKAGDHIQLIPPGSSRTPPRSFSRSPGNQGTEQMHQVHPEEDRTTSSPRISRREGEAVLPPMRWSTLATASSPMSRTGRATEVSDGVSHSAKGRSP